MYVALYANAHGINILSHLFLGCQRNFHDARQSRKGGTITEHVDKFTYLESKLLKYPGENIEIN